MVLSLADTHNIALSYVTPRCHHGLVIDVDRLMILREVARSGSKAAAARSLRLSEPTVAHHLAALERGAGVALTARAGRVTRLTPAGEALVEHADVIAASLESAERTLHHHADLQVGRLRIASFQSFCAAQLAAPLAQFARDYPGIEVGLIEAETDDSLALLNAGEADLVIGFADDATPVPLDQPVSALARDEYLLVLPENHPLARGKAVSFADLAGERWISGCARCRKLRAKAPPRIAASRGVSCPKTAPVWPRILASATICVVKPARSPRSAPRACRAALPAR